MAVKRVSVPVLLHQSDGEELPDEIDTVCHQCMFSVFSLDELNNFKQLMFEL